ncbi:MAG: GreA/GreB family elongation factor [Verrucomicrobiota bacterium]
MNKIETENWFLAQLEQPGAALGPLKEWLEAVRARGETEQADSYAQLLQESLQERRATEQALDVLKLRAAWHTGEPAFRSGCAEELLAILGPTRDHRVLVQNSGFDTALPLAECFSRLAVLRALKPDALCYDKTWGFGIVRNVDLFYQRVEIDFDKRQAHPMSLAYAAEALRLLDEDHLLVRLHRQPEQLKSVVREDPGEVVRLALRSYGPMTASQLQETLVPRLVPEGEWKGFWDAARKDLKGDPLVHVPAKRTEPIRLLERAKAYDKDWFSALARERDIETVLALVEEVARDRTAVEQETARRIVGERLAFVVKGARGEQPASVARAVMAAQDLGVSAEQVDVGKHVGEFLQDEVFLAVTRDLPARAVRPFLQFLAACDKDRTVSLLLRLLTRLNLVTLNEAMAFLGAEGKEPQCAEILREAVTSQSAEVEVVYWISRNVARLAEWSLGTLPALAYLMLSELSKDYSGERLKVRNMVRARFEQAEFLKPTLEAMNDAQRRDTVQRVRECEAWSLLDRQSVLGQIIKLYPGLQDVLAAKAPEGPAAGARGPVTSTRCYRERQAQLEKLVNVDIPQNSREIAVARSYGDLSENHEFKAAKETQGILLKRRGELEDMLHRVKPTDFKGLPHDKAGLGTQVVLQLSDGRTERYCILGEWDQDQALGIISSDTRMARALEGHKAGERVPVPAETGEVEALIVEVEGLTPEVQFWIQGT